VAKPSKQQIASVRSALREVHAELLAWGPHVLVSFNGEAQKAQVIARMGQLGWHHANDPSNDAANMLEFTLDPIPLTTTAPLARPNSGRVRRIGLPAQFFASLGIIFTLVGIITAGAAFYTDYRMSFLNKAGTLTTGEIERTYFTSGRGGRTYYVSYRFVDAQGISHQGEDPYPFEDWNSLRPGAPISITYLGDDPQTNNLTQRVRLITGRSLRVELTWIGIPWIIASFFFLSYWMRRRKTMQ
jgi:Protein of unknown function (DUF3592)